MRSLQNLRAGHNKVAANHSVVQLISFCILTKGTGISPREFYVSMFLNKGVVGNFFVIKPTRCTNYTNLFWHENLHVSESSSVHHHEFIHCKLSNGMSYRFVDSFRAVQSWSCSKTVYKPVWHIPLLSVRWINSWWWTEELSRNMQSFMPK